MGSAVALPKSFNVSLSRTSRCSDDDDLRELIRVASTRTSVDRIGVDMILKQQAAQSAMMMAGSGESRGLPKSSSVGMGKINEDRPCDFEEVGVGAGKADLFYPRSRSYAVTKRSVVF